MQGRNRVEKMGNSRKNKGFNEGYDQYDNKDQRKRNKQKRGKDDRWDDLDNKSF